MYSGVTEAFKKKIRESGRNIRARLINTSRREEVIDHGFFSIKNYAQSNENTESLSLGGTVASYIEVKMDKPEVMITGKEFEYQVGLMLDDGTWEYVPIGMFTAQKPVDEDGIISFTAYDRFVSKLGYLYVSKLSYPVDGKKVLREIQSQSGVMIADIDRLPDEIKIPERLAMIEEDNTTTPDTKPFNGFSYRETIGYLAFMYGKFATVNAKGEVELRWYEESGYKVNVNQSYNDIVCNEVEFEVQYVQCTIGENSENILISGEGTMGIGANVPVMTQEILDRVFSEIGGMRYLPTTFSFHGDPRIELGDIITVVKRDGTEIKVPVMMLNMENDGGLSTQVGSFGDDAESSEAADAGPVTKRMDRVYSELLLVKDFVATKADIGYLESNYATIKQLESMEAEIDRITATEVNTVYLEANYAKIDMANVNTANIRQGFLNNLMVDQGIIADRVVSGEVVATKTLTGVNLYADDITAGTLSVDRLILRGNNKSLVYALNNSGGLVSTQVDTLDASLLTYRTITADRIVAGSITSTEINVSDLVSTGLIGANRITAKNILVSDLQALGAKIGGFTIGNTAIYNGTDSKDSTTAGVYVGIDAIRAYSSEEAYTHIENGVLSANRCNIDGNIFIGPQGAIYLTSTMNRGPGITTEKDIKVIYSGEHPDSGNCTWYDPNKNLWLIGSVVGRGATGLNIQGALLSGTNFVDALYVRNKATFVNGFGSLAGASIKGTLYVENSLISDKCYFGSTSYYVNNTGGARLRLVKIGDTDYGLNSDGSAYLGGLSLRSKYLINDSGNLGLGNDTVRIGIFNDVFRPTNDYAGKVLLGSANYRWGQLCTTKAVSVSSDRRIKNSIEYLRDDTRYLELSKNLRPARYRLNDEDTGIYHTGFIAQDIEEDLLKSGLSKGEFAGLSIEEGNYALCYEEFIPILVLAQQAVRAQADAQEQRISNLENQIRSLQSELIILKNSAT